MYFRYRSFLFFLALILLIIVPQISGCGSREQGNQNYQESLKNDAVAGLKNAYAEDFTRITIIRGALYKFAVNPQNPQLLGTTIGAVEATVFPEEYELKRFEQLDNISAEMRKSIISQPMLGITLKKRETLNHIYNAVLKPLSANFEKRKQITPQETAVINNLINLLDNLAENYTVLSNKTVDLNSSEAQRSFITIQDTFRELQKLELVK